MRSAIFALCLLTPVLLLGEEEMQHETVEIKNEYALEEGVRLIEVENLSGVITIEAGEAGKVESQVFVHASDKEQARAKALAGKVGVQSTQDGEALKLSIEYPTSEYSIFYYPGKSDGKRSARKNRGRVAYQGREVTLFHDATPAAVELSADITLKVPQDVQVKVKNCTGKIIAQKLSGKIQAETAFGSVSFSKITGRGTVQTGLGSIQVEECQGDYSLNTGNGEIIVQSSSGALAASSGTGDITVKRCDLKELELQSGSGTLEIEKTSALTCVAHTGSGKIELDDCVVKNMIKADTGTGIIKMKGDFSTLKSLALQTGTGSITFVSTPFPALDFQLTTGSGRIENQVISEGGAGTATVRTGSGNIKISTVKKRKPNKQE